MTNIRMVWVLMDFVKHVPVFLLSMMLSKLDSNAQSLPGKHMAPEPREWYAGDIHVHKNCGTDTVVPDSLLLPMMEKNNLSVISVLADMGNGEVKFAKQDLLKVTGKDVPYSKPGRIMHWDTEWHWDATYSQFSNQALGGHLVLLGLDHAEQIWAESPYRVLEWAAKQNAVKGFAHMEYLNDSIQDELNCCIPIDYPVEAALKTIDFISEDVYATRSQNNGTYYSDGTINAYYKLLNCGFRLGLAAGTDFPCNENEPLGNLLTYVKVDGELNYDKWIEGIKNGRTVVSRNAHNEFLDLKVNGKFIPGDDVSFTGKDITAIQVKWTSIGEVTGRVELIYNGEIIATKNGKVKPEKPVIMNVSKKITNSGWLCARRMDDRGHQTHTAPVYITVDHKKFKSNPVDVQFFINWIDNILKNISDGGKWKKYFPESIDIVRKRYEEARNIYQQLLSE